MKVYLDENYIAHAENAEGYVEAESSFFDFICPEIFPSYRFIPNGHSWERADGKVFNGEAVMLIGNSFETARKQREYEKLLFSDMQTALNELGVNANG